MTSKVHSWIHPTSPLCLTPAHDSSPFLSQDLTCYIIERVTALIQLVNARSNSQSKAHSTPENISTKICVITSILLKRAYKCLFKHNSNKIKTPLASHVLRSNTRSLGPLPLSPLCYSLASKFSELDLLC